ncbi:Ketopantoate reductase ApbA/PanE [Penicillium cosmopolitanum]|uniref:2-dehydropantoate 2-reductase n=1 Tax=Penicillium cosmopolitanum TaxID=1131564 RepID=A0A9W9W551_9EURO|nr:Ketopantoate reductase ApbA/PanE [Penicillium cosmopolitanum]KAJ5403522.1 Ketopantoate reductase ApbA/PanE [Penicillium cosmopolitanum]
MSHLPRKQKREILVIGAGGVGTMACVALERSGMARVTAVLRSNYEKVVRDGFEIDSVDHGKLSGWRPSHVVNKIPDASLQRPFDYVIVTMKNIPEITNIAEIIAPSVTPNHTTIVLLQNGIYTEPPIIDAFPTNAVLSGPSYIGAHERNGHVIHDDPDRYHLGVFHNTQLDRKYEQSRLEDFASVYNGNNIEHAMVVQDIVHYRWRKALWNGIYNTMCAITQLDNAAIRRSGGEHSLIRPGMAEMAAIAKADGYDLGENIVDEMVDATPIELSFRPSMLVDVDKGNPVEVEVILGNALRVARREGVQTPILDNTYRFLKLIQNRLLTARGYIDEPKEIPTADFI